MMKRTDMSPYLSTIITSPGKGCPATATISPTRYRAVPFPLEPWQSHLQPFGQTYLRSSSRVQSSCMALADSFIISFHFLWPLT